MTAAKPPERVDVLVVRSTGELVDGKKIRRLKAGWRAPDGRTVISLWSEEADLADLKIGALEWSEGAMCPSMWFRRDIFAPLLEECRR